MNIFSIFKFKKPADKVRTQWLISFLIFNIVFIGAVIICFNLVHKWLGASCRFCSFIKVIEPCYIALILLASAAFIYYCAYKKDGIKWLMITIVKMYIFTAFFLCLTCLAPYFYYTGRFHKIHDSLPLLGIISFVLSINCVYFLINCYRLYKVNKAKRG